MYGALPISFAVLSLVPVLVRDFINNFNFWNDGTTKDPTGSSTDPSAAYYMPQASAQSQGLVWVNSEGHFGLSVDSTFTYSGTDLRPSVRITSKESIQYGLLVLDAVHLPYGEGTWPAFWLVGADGDWPNSGEIDLYEGVGDSVQNTVSYHTSEGCSYDTSQTQSGKLNTAVGTDCNALENNDEACGSVDPSTTSFGSGASNVGGGVYAVEWTSSFIKEGLSNDTWHFNRDNIPADLTDGNPSPGGWGSPVTNLASTNCDIDSHFGPQSIVFNIELCGTWEGAVFNGGPEACLSYVQQNPSTFKTAYFEINSLKYFQ
ncbi:glycoside hydrolase family 16 protein [Ramaria rubella]|nr:glycoside hydrolase family 16 protein [Ramaria rubella]